MDFASGDTVTPGALFRNGRLDEAVAAAEQRIRVTPGDANGRLLLAELLLFAGQFERVDGILVAVEAVDPGLTLVVAEFRQLLRAATARRQSFTQARKPDFLGEPTLAQSSQLRALLAGDGSDAAQAVEQAEADRPGASGSADGVIFADFRDGDDVLGGTLEVLTATGKYFWVPVERVASMQFHAAKRLRDLFWRRCTISVREGPDGDVYIPSLYEAPGALAESLRLGRRTEWSQAVPVRGFGQRVFLIGEEGVPIHQLGAVQFT